MTKPNVQVYENKEAAQKLIDHLLSENTDQSNSFYNDVHITYDGCTIIIEWTQVYYEFASDCAKFRLVDNNQEIMTEYALPDDTRVWCFDEEDYQEQLKNYEDTHTYCTKNQIMEEE